MGCGGSKKKKKEEEEGQVPGHVTVVDDEEEEEEDGHIDWSPSEKPSRKPSAVGDDSSVASEPMVLAKADTGLMLVVSPTCDVAQPTVMSPRSESGSFSSKDGSGPSPISAKIDHEYRSFLSPADSPLEKALGGQVGLLPEGMTSLLVDRRRGIVAPALNKKQKLPTMGKGKGKGRGGGAVRPGRPVDVVSARSRALRRIPLLSGVPAGDADFLTTLARSLTSRDFSPGDVLIREGDPGEEMFILAAGEVDIVSGDGRTFYATLGAGSFFGELSLLRSAPRSASIAARAHGKILILSKADFDRAIAAKPTYRRAITANAERRARRHEEQKSTMESDGKEEEEEEEGGGGGGGGNGDGTGKNSDNDEDLVRAAERAAERAGEVIAEEDEEQ